MKFKSALEWIKIISIWFNIKKWHQQLLLIIAVTNLLDRMKEMLGNKDEDWGHFVGTEVKVNGECYGYVVLYGSPKKVEKFMAKCGYTLNMSSFEPEDLNGRLVVVNHRGDLKAHPEKDILGKRWISESELKTKVTP